MDNILNQLNKSIADGIRIHASTYGVPRDSEAFEECISIAMEYWYGTEENVGKLESLPRETIKRRTMNVLNRKRKQELKHSFRETTFTDLEDNLTYEERETMSAADYIEAGGTNINTIDNLIDNLYERDKECREVVGPDWISLLKNDEDYLKWTALWTSLGMMAEKSRKYAKKHLHDKKIVPYDELLDELGKPHTNKNYIRASRAFKELKEKAQIKLNEWLEAGKQEN